MDAIPPGRVRLVTDVSPLQAAQKGTTRVLATGPINSQRWGSVCWSSSLCGHRVFLPDESFLAVGTGDELRRYPCALLERRNVPSLTWGWKIASPGPWSQIVLMSSDRKRAPRGAEWSESLLPPPHHSSLLRLAPHSVFPPPLLFPEVLSGALKNTFRPTDEGFWAAKPRMSWIFRVARKRLWKVALGVLLKPNLGSLERSVPKQVLIPSLGSFHCPS